MPATVAICSMFRNSARTLDAFRASLEAQAAPVVPSRNADPDIRLLFSFVEGDSTDDTWDLLQTWACQDPRVLVGKIDIEPVATFEERVRKRVSLGNAVIDVACRHPFDYLLWCESDLCIPPDLIRQLVEADRDVVAPAVFLGGMFYDTWGFRGLDGSRFDNAPPYHPSFQPHGLVEMSSVGSVVLFRRAVIDAGIRFRDDLEDGQLVGFCRDARAKGFRVFMDSRVSVIHPTTLWRAQQYALGRVVLERDSGVEAADPGWRGLLSVIEKHALPLLGSVDLPPDHPVFDGIRRFIEGHRPGCPFSLSARLLSESTKTYTLVVRDLSEETPARPGFPAGPRLDEEEAACRGSIR